jgi:subtilisin family serine protease
MLGIYCSLATTFAVAGEVRNFDKPHVEGQFLVRYKGDVKSLSRPGMQVSQHFTSGSALIKVAEKSLTVEVARALANDPNVLSVEADTIIHAYTERRPNDPDFEKQWALEKIQAPTAWDRHTGSRNVVVAVIDTGVDYTHPDLSPNYWQNRGETGNDADGNDKSSNGIDDDENGLIDDFRGWDFANDDNDPMDDNEHGTHCAGVIGAAGNNESGIAGVNWGVSIVGLKFLTGTGSGNLSNAVAAIEYATKLGVDVMSNSWGGGGFSDTMDAAVKAAADKGIIFVAAAGNWGSDNDAEPEYPASYKYDNVIAVAATDKDDKLADFSNFGATSVHIAAPGVDIYSTVPGEGYAELSGTSMAAPHVSGAVALVMARNSRWSARTVKNAILNTVDPLDEVAVSAKGRLNLAKALAYRPRR